MGQTHAKPKSLAVKILGCEEHRQQLKAALESTTERGLAVFLAQQLEAIDMELNGLQQQQKEEASLEWLAMRDKSAIEAAARRKHMMHQQEVSLRRSGIDPRKFAEEAKKMAKNLDQTRSTIRRGVEEQRNAMQAAVEIDRDRMVDEEDERREMEEEERGAVEQQVGEAGMVKTDWMRLWEKAREKDRHQQPPRRLASAQQREDPVPPNGALRDSDR